jgi:lipopolysaccharide/colanic/teichoic acid biosynthesis glycosyltransferase
VTGRRHLVGAVSDTDATAEPLHSAWALAVKRTIDIVVSCLALLLLWPLLAVISIAVRSSSQGPALYRGVRGGLRGRPFRILKFRTMVVDAEALGGPTTGTADRRVTRVGALLRRTKLDELPQFFNVLVGDMSLVGPRPEVMEYVALYRGPEKTILSMRPGITDYASIEFADLDDRVGSLDPDAYFREHILPRKNALRVRYVTEWSLRTDFVILAATVGRLARRVAR